MHCLWKTDSDTQTSSQNYQRLQLLIVLVSFLCFQAFGLRSLSQASNKDTRWRFPCSFLLCVERFQPAETSGNEGRRVFCQDRFWFSTWQIEIFL